MCTRLERHHADVDLHTDMQLVAFLGLVKLLVSGACAVLRETRRSDQGDFDGCAALRQQALGGQRSVDRGQYLQAELMLFEKKT
jgi:hypothetical protein